MFRVIDIFEGQKGDQGGSPKMAKIQHGVKRDIFKRAKGQNSIWGKTRHLKNYCCPPNSPNELHNWNALHSGDPTRPNGTVTVPSPR